MASVVKTKPSKAEAALCVLVVDDEADLVEFVSDITTRTLKCSVLTARNMTEARRILADHPVELLVTDVHLPDGDGMGLLADLRAGNPSAEAIAITGAPSLDGTIAAMREGFSDLIAKPFTSDQITDRLKLAMARFAQRRRREKRVAALRRTVRRLNEARRLVSKKVDLLCNDLIGAYTELSKQVDSVRLQHGYRQFIKGAADLEQLLCHTMDWMLRQVGYANVALFLAADDQEFNLGAYMKYTVAGESGLTDALERNLVRMAVRKGMVHLKADDAATLLTQPELKYLAGQDVLACNCTYLGDTLAVVVMFRDAKTPFSDADVDALKMISPLFAVSLTKAVKGGGLNGEDEIEDLQDDAPDAPSAGSTDVADESSEPPQAPKSPNKKDKRDPADWWKRGETPPF